MPRLRDLPTELRLMIYSLGDLLQMRIDGGLPSLLLSFEFDPMLYSEVLEVYGKSDAVIGIQKNPKRDQPFAICPFGAGVLRSNTRELFGEKVMIRKLQNTNSAKPRIS
jgi:hypothetical protein